jgi:hypothetical protein
MANQEEDTSGRAGQGTYRHDEDFWRDMLAQWRHSGGSIRPSAGRGSPFDSLAIYRGSHL